MSDDVSEDDVGDAAASDREGEAASDLQDPVASADEGVREAIESRRWWLHLQITLALAGGAVWFAGAAMELDFLAGVGCGLIVAALLLRLGRTSAERS